MKGRKLLFLTLIGLILSCTKTPDPEPIANGEKILMFIAPDNVYYSEYIISYEGLKSMGYTVELFSVKEQDVVPYMLPAGTTIEETANTLPGSNKFNEFKIQFKDMFGSDWNQNLNSVPPKISGVKSIFAVQNFDAYKGLVIPGGTGILNLRADDSFEAQAGISANEIELAADRLNLLAEEALQSGKPVLAQCHGASLPVFWKINGGVTPLMMGEQAAGYPDPQTASTYQSLGVELRADDKVVVSSPNTALTNSINGDYKMITSRDWYPQTVAHATKVFINVLETYPDIAHRQAQHKVLILHGGSINESNCSSSNRSNDIPCNYGTGDNLPADFTHLKALLQVNHHDGYNFLVSDVNMVGSNLPYSIDNQSSIENYLENFDAVVFFKHWSTGISIAMQNALVAYADNGGGVLALHHAFYNDVDDANSALNKNILTTELFGATSEELGWSATRENYKLYSTNYGHFVSTCHILTTNTQEAPFNWSSNALPNTTNKSLSLYPVINIYDEVYNNKAFVMPVIFGNEVNKITPLYSNNLSGAQAHTEGFVKLFNKNGDGKIGKVACFQPGESRASFSLSNPYAQVIRNAVVWMTF